MKQRLSKHRDQLVDHGRDKGYGATSPPADTDCCGYSTERISAACRHSPHTASARTPGRSATSTPKLPCWYWSASSTTTDQHVETVARLAGLRRDIHHRMHALVVGVRESARDLIAGALPTGQSFKAAGDLSVIQQCGQRSHAARSMGCTIGPRVDRFDLFLGRSALQAVRVSHGSGVHRRFLDMQR